MSQVSLKLKWFKLGSGVNSFYDPTQASKYQEILIPGQVKPLNVSSKFAKGRKQAEAILLVDIDDVPQDQKDAYYLNKSVVQALGNDILNKDIVPTSYLSKLEFLELLSDRQKNDSKLSKLVEKLEQLQKAVAEKAAAEKAAAEKQVPAS